MQTKKSFESQLVNLSLFASIPSFILLIIMMFYANISIFLILLILLLGSVSIVFCHTQIHQKSAHQFRNLSNLLDAMIREDYTLKARPSHGDIALNELVDSINTLSNRLNKQRIESVESQLLLNTIIKHIDVAIIALNANNEPVLINPTAEKLLHISEATLQDSSSKQLEQLKQLGQLASKESRVMPLTFGSQQGKFNVHIEEFREAGKPHKLLFITDVRTLLRSEERNAWQSLVRVISHEINNSLAPISSISQTLKRTLTRLTREENVESCKDNLLEGLSIIAQRASNLSDFVNSYKQISQVPEPKKQYVSIASLVEKVIPLYQNTLNKNTLNQNPTYPKSRIIVSSSKDVELYIDPVQFEQVLINLIKNAVESIQNKGSTGEVNVSWQMNENLFSLIISDEGSGISNKDNLFVPFYTTKNQGSGIGLVLCRQILEVHNGQLNLIDREDKSGCLAIIELPIY
jgi:two-component system nitrogen regulation sensor histidine kinase NtrY